MAIDPATVGTSGVQGSADYGFDPALAQAFKEKLNQSVNNAGEAGGGQRYAFLDTSTQTKTDAAPKTEGTSGGSNWWLKPGLGLMTFGRLGAEHAADIGARRAEATQYYGAGLGLRVYADGKPGPNGEKAAFLKGPSGKEEILPVRVELRDDVMRFHGQKLEQVVKFDPAELGRAFDLNQLSPEDRARLTAKPTDAPSHPDKQPQAPTEPKEYGFVTRTREEANLIQSMIAQGKSQQEIQFALDNLRGLSGVDAKLSKNVPTWSGSGPKDGMLGINSASQSNAALKNFNPAGAVEYIFDPETSTFLVRGSHQPFKHSFLAEAIGADSSKVVGGMLTRGENGLFSTNEGSGHFYRNWTPEVRAQFQDAMKSYGVPIEHTTGF